MLMQLPFFRMLCWKLNLMVKNKSTPCYRYEELLLISQNKSFYRLLLIQFFIISMQNNTANWWNQIHCIKYMYGIYVCMSMCLCVCVIVFVFVCVFVCVSVGGGGWGVGGRGSDLNVVFAIAVRLNVLISQ